MDAEDRELFDRSNAAAVDGAGRDGPTLDAALADLGWHDALADDPQAAISVLFAHLGRADATCAALDHVVAAGLGPGLDAAEASVVVPALGRIEPPGRPDGTTFAVQGLASARILDQATALVPVAVGSGDGVASVEVVEVPTASLALRPVGGIDPEAGLVVVTAGSVDAGAAGSATAVDWPATVALAQLAVGHQLVGASRQMLELAREHALDRIQFGAPIARFQAVRHRLAETLVAVESAEALLAGAWADGLPVTAAMAKAAAGRSARTAARHCQQVLAGIGFTTEHDLHRYVRRILVLDELFGSSRALTASLGAEVLATGELPPLLPL